MPFRLLGSKGAFDPNILLLILAIFLIRFKGMFQIGTYLLGTRCIASSYNAFLIMRMLHPSLYS